MNGNNEKKDVKQTSNEQPGIKQSLADLSTRVGCGHEGLKRDHAAIVEQQQQIKEALSGLSTRVGCGHKDLMHDHTAIVEYVQEINNRLDRIEQSLVAMAGAIRAINVRLITIQQALPEEPEPQPETVEQPAENETAKSDKPTEKTGSGL